MRGEAHNNWYSITVIITLHSLPHHAMVFHLLGFNYWKALCVKARQATSTVYTCHSLLTQWFSSHRPSHLNKKSFRKKIQFLGFCFIICTKRNYIGLPYVWGKPGQKLTSCWKSEQFGFAQIPKNNSHNLEMVSCNIIIVTRWRIVGLVKDISLPGPKARRGGHLKVRSFLIPYTKNDWTGSFSSFFSTANGTASFTTPPGSCIL